MTIGPDLALQIAIVQHAAGLRAMAAGRHAEAAELIARAVAHAPAVAEYHSDLGVALRHLGRLDEAVASFQRAIALRPDGPDFHYNLGHALDGLRRYDEAIASYQRALELRPGDAEAHNAIGNALADHGRPHDAIAAYKRALELSPDYAEAHNNLGAAYLELGQFDEETASFQRAVALKPDYAEAHWNLGAAWVRQGVLAQAMSCFRRAVALREDYATAHWSLAITLLTLGHFEDGWREYEWRWRSASEACPRRNFSAPQWDGTAAPGQTILVHAEQGLGDTIQFARYLPLVRERAGAGRVIFECPAPLARLLAPAAGGGFDIVARYNLDVTTLPFDQHVPLLSLPLTLRVFEPLPIPAPYVHADAELRAAWRARLGPRAGLRVGLAWAGNPAHTHDRQRSIAFETLRPLLRVPGVSFYSLQFSHPEIPLIDHTAHITDFADTAALMAELDLIISVDTASAHLAGALGRPVWTLVQFVPDWRWGLEREDTAWYPTMRLFRQPATGDWDSVVQRVADELSAMR